MHFVTEPEIARADTACKVTVLSLSKVLTSGGSEVRFPEEAKNFHKSFQPHPVFHPMDTEGGTPRLKRPERQAGHSRPPSSEVKKNNRGSILSVPDTLP